MAKLLNITDAERQGVTVTFNVNRYEVYAASGFLLTAADSKSSLKQQLAENGIVDAKFDGDAVRAYLRNY